ncbi:MAG: ABC transporter ATP-binding protein [Planctomycetes bacterium]|nr:ABC transporter ATP-binding protein [Planctomycetota bacterium]
MTQEPDQAPSGGEPARDSAPGAAPAPATPSERPVAVRTKGLTKAYDGKVALDGLDLEIREGDIFGYIGPNGAGKTTTLRILAALLLPTRGRAEIAGIDVVKEPRRIKELVGYMPDAFGVYENMTLLEYLDFFGAAYKIPKPKRRRVIEDVLALTDLAGKRTDPVSAFSRGMKQRACLAKTLLHDPAVLLLDEPASGLDPRARIELRELLRELQRMGKTIVVSSHILTELSTICSTVGILESGKLVAAGPVEEILRRVSAHREFVVDLLEPGDAARAAAWLQKAPGVERVEALDGSVRVALQATEPQVAALIEGLVAERIRFTSFREERADLETAFMTLTKGQLA